MRLIFEREKQKDGVFIDLISLDQLSPYCQKSSQEVYS